MMVLAIASQAVMTGTAHALPSTSFAYSELYSVPSTCSNCHVGGGQSEFNLNPYGNRLRSLLDPNDNDPASRDNAAEILRALEAAEIDGQINTPPGAVFSADAGYAPSISSALTNEVAAAATSETVSFRGGRLLNGNAVNITSVETPNVTGFSFTPSGTTVRINILLNALQRGTLRRAGNPVEFQFIPQNADGLFPTGDGAGEALELNRFSMTFANNAPVAVADAFSANEAEGTISGNVIEQTDLLTGTRDEDIDGDPFEAELVSGPTAGSFATPLAADGSFVFQIPSPLPAGPITFEYRLRENLTGETELVSNTVTVTLNIQPIAVNGQPVAEDDAFSTDEDVAFSGDLTAANPTTPDSDPDGDALELETQLVTGPQKGTLTPTIVGGKWLGAFTYTPFADEFGTDTVVYTLTDGNLTDTATATITIDPINDAPRTEVVTQANVNETQGVQTIDLLDPRFVVDVDDDAANLTVVDFSVDPVDGVVFTRNGRTLTFDATQFSELDDGENATFTFRYSVEDDDGARSVAEAAITQTVIGIDNGLGRIAGEYANTLRARYLNHFQPTDVANDSCHSCHIPGQVDVEVREVSDCSQDVFNPYGFAICIDRDPGQPALSDLLRRLVSREAEFAPTLAGAPPLEIDESAAVGDLIGAPLQTNAGKNVQGLPSSVIDFAIVSGGVLAATDASGQFTIDSTGQLRVAQTLVPGAYTLDIRPINDAGQLDANGAPRPGERGFFPIERNLLRFVTITVNSAAPVAINDAVNVPEAVASIIDVLANDVGGTADTIAIITGPGNGVAAVNGDNTITYTPNGGFTGADSLTYRSTGAGGDSLDATVAINVVASGGAIAIPDSATTFINVPVTVDVIANDLGNRPITASIVTNPTEGVASVVNGTEILFTAPTDFSGTVVLTYAATNGIASSNADLTIVVNPASGAFIEGGTDDPALKPVARALGDSCTAINAAAGTASADQTDLLNICAEIANEIQNGGNIDGALGAIRNEEMLAVSDMAATTGRSMRSAVFQRLRNTRGGTGRGVDFTGFNVRLGDQAISSAAFAGLFDYVGKLSGQDGAPDDGVAGLPIGVFLSGEIVFAEQERSSTSDGFDLTSFSITGGADYALSEHVIIGAALGYAHSETDFGGGGGLDANSYQVSLYGSVDHLMTPGLRLDGALSAGTSSYDSARRIQFAAGGAAIDRTALADFNGQHVNAVARLEYGLSRVAGYADYPARDSIANLDISVFGELDYLHARTNAYTETGAGGLSLAVQSQSTNSLLGEAGIHVGVPVHTGYGTLTPFVEVSANAELLNDRPQVTASFAAVGAGAPVFTVVGEKQNPLFGRFRTGLTGTLWGADITADYETSFGRGSFSEQSFSFGMGGPFVGSDWLSADIGLAFAPDGSSDLAMQFSLGYEFKF